MKLEPKDLFDAAPVFALHALKEVPGRYPDQIHHAISCLKCGQAFEFTEEQVGLYTKRLLGITCPKCGFKQAVGPVPRLYQIDIGPNFNQEAFCSRVREFANEYWDTRPDDRRQIYGWIEDHLILCHPCGLALEETAEAYRRQVEYRQNRGPKDWSPRGEMPLSPDPPVPF